MTQREAIDKLEEILGHELTGEECKCTGMPETCTVDECMLCSVRDCPGNEPLHYHHDGCPYCYTAEEVDPKTKLSRNERLQAAADAGYDTWEDYRGEK
jgi:hypothetical protein